MANDNITQLIGFYNSLRIIVPEGEAKEKIITEIENIDIIIYDTESEIKEYLLSQYISGDHVSVMRVLDVLNTHRNELKKMLDVSIHIDYKGDDFLFDSEYTNRQIELKINSIEKISTYGNELLNKVQIQNGPEIDFDVTAALKICLLKELGVIDKLAEKGLAANKMAELIKFLTKEPIKTGAVNVTLGRIHNEGLMEKYQSEIATSKLKFGITQ